MCRVSRGLAPTFVFGVAKGEGKGVVWEGTYGIGTGWYGVSVWACGYFLRRLGRSVSGGGFVCMYSLLLSGQFDGLWETYR